MKIDLRWLLIYTMSIVVLVACGVLGLLGRLWEVDPTRISLGILALYLIVSPFIGWLSAGFGDVKRFRRACGFTPELMAGLGMLGTVIGFLLMFGGFAAVDVSNAQATQAMLGKMAAGIAVALVTTLTGIACGMLVQLQLVNLDIVRRR